jgi:hypothetical protein
MHFATVLAVCPFAVVPLGVGCSNDDETTSQTQQLLRNEPTVFVPTGHLASPQGIAVDGNGDISVADTWNGVIRKFSPLGYGLRIYE